MRVADTRFPSTPMLSRHNGKTNTAYERLVEAFKMHGTRWYEQDESYHLWIHGDVEKLLQDSAHFSSCCSDLALERTASIVAQAANEAANRSWIGHPDEDLHHTLQAATAVSILVREVASFAE